ncbi:MAG: DNA polymerase subunit beta [Methylomonas sp.]|nr:MAG: DNA polymerase subunit beta [Methylomonas sp.]
MNRQQALETLSKLKPQLVERFGVTRLALFGSTVRDEAKPGSDIDVVVAFDSPATSAKYFGVQFYLEDELGAPVDLVTENAIRPELRTFIEQEAINV